MIPFVESLLNRVLDAASERRKAARKVTVRALPRRSDEAPRIIEIDNSHGEEPVYDCVVEELRASATEYERVGWCREVQAGQRVPIELANTAGTRRPHQAPLVRVTFRQDGSWWRKDSSGTLRRTRAPQDPGPRAKA